MVCINPPPHDNIFKIPHACSSIFGDGRHVFENMKLAILFQSEDLGAGSLDTPAARGFMDAFRDWLLLKILQHTYVRRT